jgi:mRNA interferase RelE/StbE
MYTIDLKSKAKKFISKQDQVMQKRIRDSLLKLAENPFDFKNKNIVKLSGYKSVYRLRMADIRIKYEIIGGQLIITVLDIDNRGQIYK